MAEISTSYKTLMSKIKTVLVESQDICRPRLKAQSHCTKNTQYTSSFHRLELAANMPVLHLHWPWTVLSFVYTTENILVIDFRVYGFDFHLCEL